MYLNESKINIILPCYNEEEYIYNYIKQWKQLFPDCNIIVCDNNSTDNSSHLAKLAGAIVLKESIQGKGAAIKTLLKYINSDSIIIMSDADNTYIPTKRILAPIILGNSSLVIGNRLHRDYFLSQDSIFNKIGNLFLSIIYKIFKLTIKDPLSGLRCFTTDFIKDFICSNGFEIETEMNFYAIKNNYKISNINIHYQGRDKNNKSKLSPLKDGYKIIKLTFINIIKLYHEKFKT